MFETRHLADGRMLRAPHESPNIAAPAETWPTAGATSVEAARRLTTLNANADALRESSVSYEDDQGGSACASGAQAHAGSISLSPEK